MAAFFLPSAEVLQLSDFQFSIQKCDALGGLEGILEGSWAGGLVGGWWWFALSGLPSVLLCPAQKHYNTSASDLHLSGAPNTSARQCTLVVV